MVPNAIHFLQGLSKLATLDLVLAKPKSYNRPERSVIVEMLGIPVMRLNRELGADPHRLSEVLSGAGLDEQGLALLDIGGYFARSADALNAELGGSLVGIMEGTENGAQRYDTSPPATVPVITVARSPLKLPEDYLVGSSVVFSIEAVLREQAEILQTRRACVIGYGRVGSGVADVLRGRGIPTAVYDLDPVAVANAAARGFEVFATLAPALQRSSLVVCATGNKALDAKHFRMVRPDTVVASVTSSDDELDLTGIGDTHDRFDHSPHIVEYVSRSDNGATFWLINDGNAANFLHGAVIGPAIQLIEGEKLAAVATIASGGLTDVGGPLAEVSADLRRQVATTWVKHFAAQTT
jgi:adenosylhomocysteinase